MSDSAIDMPTQTPQVPPKREEKAGRGIRTISSIPGVADIFRRFRVWNRHVNRLFSAQPTELLIDQVGTHPQHISLISNDSPAQELTATSQSGQEKLYVPQKFTLGPFYHKPDSDESEIIKGSLICIRYEDCHFKEELENNMRANGFMSEVRAWYTRLQCPLINEEGRRRKMDLYRDDDLARMMARDGLFLLEFLRFIGGLPQSNASPFHRCRSEISASRVRHADDFFQSRVQHFAVQEDVMKIGNQIPLFVLQKILQWETSMYQRDSDKDTNNLIHQGQTNTDQSLDYILKQAWPKLAPIQNMCDSEDLHVTLGVSWKGDSHLLEFVYENIISSSYVKYPSKSRRNNKRVSRITLPQAAQLRDKGVKFAPNRGPLNEIRFEGRNCTLYLPVMEMDGQTDAVLRNLQLIEIFKQDKESKPLMSYVDLIERLIDNANDVQVLRNGGIIQSRLGTDNDVADGWKRMRQQLAKNIKYEPIDIAIYGFRSFYTSKRRTMFAEIYGRYFPKSWSGICLCAACILLGLKLIQIYLTWEHSAFNDKVCTNHNGVILANSIRLYSVSYTKSDVFMSSCSHSN